MNINLIHDILFLKNLLKNFIANFSLFENLKLTVRVWIKNNFLRMSDF